MILTCYSCPRQLAFKGKGEVARRRHASLFGWLERAGRFLCGECGGRAA